MTRLSQSPRRTEGKRVHGRSARVQSAVLRATAEELGRVGFAALRIEDVALRSGVNKTTIYRRWPTKQELVRASLCCDRAEQKFAVSGDRLSIVPKF